MENFENVVCFCGTVLPGKVEVCYNCGEQVKQRPAQENVDGTDGLDIIDEQNANENFQE